MICTKSLTPPMSLVGNNVGSCFENVDTIDLLIINQHERTEVILFIIRFARSNKMFVV